MSQLKLLPSLFGIKGNGTIDMSTIIKKLQDMSRNRRFLVSEVENIVTLLLLLRATNAESERIYSALKHVKAYLRSTMGSNRLHALRLMHIHKNILDNINLADVLRMNFLIEETAENKHSGIFLRIIHNISKIKLIFSRYFSYIYISTNILPSIH